ncbi:hypothetical protein N7466_001031 [Penicillium verhagenii]|uniref:uncharacterized protein n=1 Tax=Penicillium verhagenii TaxID=1562060 RepID=UPI0025458E28|nr:uncharacterized protein N7466_001031 [Penicillium verhagenii]KAJ5948016.1 hypothetical protein N7466_001031 [Penicillium verhagenii]
MAEMGILQTENPLPSPAFTNAIPENTLEAEDWKHRPPYHTHGHDTFGPIKWKGSCKCGKITYALNRDRPLNAKFCHCRGCQVMHGAPFQWAAIFHKDDVSFTKGSSGLAFFSAAHNSQKYDNPTKVSCSFCHTLIMDEGRNMCLLFPQLIHLEGSSDERRKRLEEFKPTCHIYYEQRMFDVPDGRPKWSEMDEHSQLLDDHGKPIQ